MVIPSLIQHKRDGNAIAAEDWARLIADYTAGRVPDYQMSALLMAIVFRGLTPAELAAQLLLPLFHVQIGRPAERREFGLADLGATVLRTHATRMAST